MEFFMKNFSWESDESCILFNPCYSAKVQEQIKFILSSTAEWKGHVWLSTSGTLGAKWVGLSKQAILSSALSVNHHLECSKSDRWINALPNFHVGGVGIWARAYLTQSTVDDFRQDFPGKWNPANFHQYLFQKKGTITSLVPTQLHDLTSLNLKPPSSLRAVIIGGGALHPNLYEKATSLGWPILPSYGLTECASQVATAPLKSLNENKMPELQLLTHLTAKVQNGCLCFAGSSLLSAYAVQEGDTVKIIDPKLDGWFISGDRGYSQNQHLSIFGRMDEMIKVSGESVDLSRLNTHLQTLCTKIHFRSDALLVAMPDDRLGCSIHLVISHQDLDEINFLIQSFQTTVLPFEKIRKVVLIDSFPRSSLGKILLSELKNLIITHLTQKKWDLD